MCLPVLPALRSLPPHSHSIARLYTAGSPFSSRPHRSRGATSEVSGLHILPHCSRPFHSLARSLPIPDITADTAARALLTGWISSFGCPQTIAIDQGRQFESQHFHSLAKLCGIQLSRTTAHHPAANGLMERFRRTLKAAIMCHANQQWTEELPLVLMGILTAFKDDLQASVIALMYGEPLRIPGELLTPTADPVDPAHFITQLRQHMACRRPVPAARHAPPTAVPTRSRHGEGRQYNSSCTAGPSAYQPTGSSQPTCSTGLTAGTSSSTPMLT
jgi:hypothetical protein